MTSHSKINAKMLQDTIAIINHNTTEEKVEQFNFNETFRKFKRSIAIGSEMQYREYSNILRESFHIENVEDLYQQKHPEKDNVLQVACLNHRFGLVKYLVDQCGFQAKINQKNENGQTPIHLVVTNLMTDIYKNCDLFDYLVEKGADLLSLNLKGENIMQVAKKLDNNQLAFDHIKKTYELRYHERQKAITLYVLNYTKAGKEQYPYNSISKNTKSIMLEFI